MCLSTISTLTFRKIQSQQWTWDCCRLHLSKAHTGEFTQTSGDEDWLNLIKYKTIYHCKACHGEGAFWEPFGAVVGCVSVNCNVLLLCLKDRYLFKFVINEII